MRTFLILFFLLIFKITSAQNSPQIDWQFGTVGDDFGKVAIFVEDVDDNGYLDIISTSEFNHGSFLSTLEYDNDKKIYVTKRMSNHYNEVFQSAQLYDFDENNHKEIYVGLKNGRILKYNSNTLRKDLEINTLYVEPEFFYDTSIPINGIEFIDIDNNKSIDLVALSTDTTFVLNSNYELLYEIPFGAKHFKIGNIDEDDHKEIIYSSGKIIEWQENNAVEEINFFTYNKNVKVGLSDMNNDNVSDVIYSSRDTLYAYDFKAKELIWSKVGQDDRGNTFYEVIDFWLFDYNMDMITDILVSYHNADNLYGYNGKTGDLEFDFFTDGRDEPDNIRIADFDNDSEAELLWATGINYTGPDFYYIYDISTGKKEYQNRDFEGDFKAFDVGDVDNDGEIEIVSGLFGEYLHRSNEYGFLTIFNAKTKDIKWQNNEVFFDGRLDDFTKVKIGDIDNDNLNELLIGIEFTSSSSFVYVLDSLYNKERFFEIDGMSIILDMNISDIDNNGKNELIVTSGTNVSGGTNIDEWNNHIYIFDGETGNLKWKSEQLAGIDSKIGSLVVGNIDDDEAKEVLAVRYLSQREKSVLYVIDGITYELNMDTSRRYTSLDLADINNDGIDDIVAGVAIDKYVNRVALGQIEIIDGQTLETLDAFETNTGGLTSIKAYDLNNDEKLEIVLTDYYTLGLFDLENKSLKWRSDTLNNFVGAYNSLFVGNIDADSYVEILVNVQHGLFSFETDYNQITNIEFIDNYNEVETIKCYPNPVIDVLTIEILPYHNIPKLIDLEIYDTKGCLVLQKQNLNSQNLKNIDINKLKPGFYYMSLIKNGKIHSTNKIIKGL